MDRRSIAALAGILLLLTGGCVGGQSADERDIATYEVKTPTHPPTSTPVPSATELVALNLHRGDATLLRNGNGVLLIDTGGDPNATRIRGWLSSAGVDRVDLLVATGVAAGEIGGAAAVIEHHRPGAVLQNGLVTRSEAYHRYLRAVVRADRGGRLYRVTSRTGFQFGNGTVAVLAPPDPPLNDGQPADNVIVLAYELRGSRVLVLGDASRAEQRWLRNRSESNLRASVVVVDDPSVPTESLLRTADPELVIVGGNGSTTANVPDGPWTIRRTATDGTIRVTVPLEATPSNGAPPAPETATPGQATT